VWGGGVWGGAMDNFHRTRGSAVALSPSEKFQRKTWNVKSATPAKILRRGKGGPVSEGKTVKKPQKKKKKKKNKKKGTQPKHKKNQTRRKKKTKRTKKKHKNKKKPQKKKKHQTRSMSIKGDRPISEKT